MTRLRCASHKNSTMFPEGCATCVRIRLEGRIVSKTVTALLTAGYKLRVNDGESIRPDQPTSSSVAILEQIMEVDDEYLEAHKGGSKELSWVRFVYGNDGYDVINDYTVDLEDVLKSVNEYADRMGGN